MFVTLDTDFYMPAFGEMMLDKNSKFCNENYI